MKRWQQNQVRHRQTADQYKDLRHYANLSDANPAQSEFSLLGTGQPDT